MDAVVLLVAVALVSLVIARVATVALSITGLSRESARFQARSALTGVGFTTSESESVVNHPVRRRIVMALMLVGSLGLATAIAGVLGTFLGAGAGAQASRAGVLIVSLIALYVAARSPVIDRWLSRVIARSLHRYTNLDARDYERLLHLARDYAVQELAIADDHWLAGRSLGDARLRDEGVLVLGITRRGGCYFGVPNKATIVEAGDVVIAYGRGDTIARLAERRRGESGDADHRAAVRDERSVADDERRADREITQ